MTHPAAWRRTLPAVVVLLLAACAALAIGGVIVFTVAAGVLDVVEISRQLSTDRGGLAVLAMVIAVLRVATLAGAAVLWHAAPARAAAPAG